MIVQSKALRSTKERKRNKVNRLVLDKVDICDDGKASGIDGRLGAGGSYS